MKALIKAAVVAVLLTSVPALANGGWRDGHRHHNPHWKQGHHKHPVHPRHWRESRRVVEHVHRNDAYPVQSASASASPGIHVIFPDVYFPWPQ